MNEKWFVVQRTKTKGSETYAIAETIKDSLADARALYHQILASVYANADIEYAAIKIDDYYGNSIVMETIVPAQPEPNTEE